MRPTDQKSNNEKHENRQKKYSLKDTLDENVNLFRQIFANDDTLVTRYFENQQNNPVKCCILFIEGMVDNKIVNESIIQPVIQNGQIRNYGDITDILLKQVIVTNNIEITSDVNTMIQGITGGDTVLLSDGSSEGLVISSKGWKTRDITEPQFERSLRGPREGFTESLQINLSLIRKKLETPDLKIKYMTLGSQTRTKISICYLDSIVNKKILDEVERRLKDIHTDGILDSGYIQEFIRDTPFTPFYTIGNTEKPDNVAGKLLEGRVAILSEGSPTALTIPYLFAENFQSSEDYYLNFYLASINRILRIIAFFFSISVPAVYVALVTFHQEAIPTPLLLSISAARQGVPFPTIVEIIVLLVVFELLREAGVRMPSNIGQALSIVGALVLGQASVEARLVSAPIVIVVSLTAITSLMIPRITGAIIILRLIFLLLSAFIGLYGYLFGMVGLLISLCEVRSFGVPYMSQLTNLNPEDIKDIAIRAPWWYLKYRPKLIGRNSVRQSGGGKSS